MNSGGAYIDILGTLRRIVDEAEAKECLKEDRYVHIWRESIEVEQIIEARDNAMKEQDIQAKIQKYIKARGGYVIKTVTSNRAGVPDLLACVDGRFIGIEVKMPGAKASPLQLANGAMIEAAGGLFLVATSATEVRDYLDAYL